MDERNFAYLCYGLAAAWALIVLYVISLAGRERQIRRELETLKRIVAEPRERAAANEGETR
jgi:CcmD family protein